MEYSSKFQNILQISSTFKTFLKRFFPQDHDLKVSMENDAYYVACTVYYISCWKFIISDNDRNLARPSQQDEKPYWDC